MRMCVVGVSGRARSDPTHQHQKRQGALHLHAVHPSAGGGGMLSTAPMPSSPPSQHYLATTSVLMECESPQSSIAKSFSTHQRQLQLLQQQKLFAAQQALGLVEMCQTWSSGDMKSDDRRTGQYTGSVQSGHRLHRLKADTLLSTDQRELPHPTHLIDSHTPPISVNLTDLDAPIVSSLSIDATQVGSAGLPLSVVGMSRSNAPAGVRAHQPHYANATVPPRTYISPRNFAFGTVLGTTTTTATSAADASPISAGRLSERPDRGDDSPMVGVCIQQSPVASH